MKINRFRLAVGLAGIFAIALTGASHYGLRPSLAKKTGVAPPRKSFTSEEWKAIEKRIRAKMPRLSAAQKANYQKVVVQGVSAKARKNPHILIADCEADYFYLSSDDMVNYSDAIIVAAPVLPFVDRTRGAVYAAGTTDMLDFWVSTNVTIQQVVKQPAGTPLQVGQILRMVEPLGLFDENGQLTKLQTDNCFELQQSSRYLLFLDEKDSDGERPNVNLNFGRINLDATDANDDITTRQNGGTATKKATMKAQLLTRFNITATSFLPTTYLKTPFTVRQFNNAPYVELAVDQPCNPPAGSQMIIERNLDNNGWIEIKRLNAILNCNQNPTVVALDPYPTAADSCSYRMRMINGTRTSLYSEQAKLK